MKYFYCPHCNKQLENCNIYYECENKNEFYCDTCNKTYIVEDNGEYIEE